MATIVDVPKKTPHAGEKYKVENCPVCDSKAEFDMYDDLYIIFCKSSAFHNQPNDLSRMDKDPAVAAERWNKSCKKEKK